MHRFVLYIPQRDRHGAPLADHVEWMKDAARLLCKLNGGATHYRATGMWLNDDDQIIEEPVHVIVSFTEDEFISVSIRQFIERFAIQTDQECVLTEFDGALEFHTLEIVNSPDD